MNIKMKVSKIALTGSMIVGLFAYNLTGINAAGTPPEDWAFIASSKPLNDAIIARYPSIDVNADGYISIVEANAYTGVLFIDNIPYVDANAIGGTIDGLENFVNITQLSLAVQKLSGHLDFNFVNLYSVNLGMNNITVTVPDSFYSNNADLWAFSLNDVTFTNTDVFTKIVAMSNLRTLGLSNTGQTGTIPDLSNLTLVSNLALENNNLTGEVHPSIYNLPLFSLRLNGNSGLTGDVTTGFANHPTINLLDVRGTSTTQVKPTVTQNLDFYFDMFNVAGDGLNPNASVADINELISLLKEKNTKNETILGSSYYPFYDNLVNAEENDIKIAEELIATQPQVIDLLNTDKSDLAANITQVTINTVRAEVNAMTPSLAKDKLMEDVNLAQSYLAAKTNVGALMNASKNAIVAGLAQIDIDIAMVNVSSLPSGSLKDALLADIATAQALFDAKANVDAMFTDANQNELVSTVTQAVIDAVTTEVNALIPGATKDELLASIAVAQSLLDAKTSVLNLMNTDKNALMPTTDQAAIIDAQTAVTALPSGPTKDALQQDVTTAQNLLDAKGKVGELLNVGKESLKPNVGQSQIDDAQNAVNKLPAGPTKDAYQKEINTAQDILDATNKVGGLVTSDQTALTPGVGQVQIDAAQNAVNKLPAGTIKDELQTIIDKAEELLKSKDAASELSDAQDKVGILLNTGKTDLKPGIGQTQMDAAQNAVNKLPAGTDKDTLQADVTLAQNLLNAKNKVGGLLTSDKTGLQNGVNQVQIDAAQNEVNKLPAGPVKVTLQNEINIAQNILDAKNKVGGLLTSDKTGLNDGIGQSQIDAAQNAVNKLPSGPTKDELQKEIDIAKNILDAIYKVIDLITDDLSGLKPGVGQAQIDAAQNAINKLPAGETKDDLQFILDYAQSILDGITVTTPVEQIKDKTVILDNGYIGVKTADESNSSLFGMMMLASGFTFVAFMLRKKLEKNSK